MPTLHWIGKDKVINHHLDVPFKILVELEDVHLAQGLNYLVVYKIR